MSQPRELYHRLLNAERDPRAKEEAAVFLDSRLAAARSLVARDLGVNSPSLASFYHRYDEDAVRRLLDGEYADTVRRYDNYVARWRDAETAGQPLERRNEMLPSFEYARIWLANIAPTKLVDGSWLQHAHKVSVPEELRRFHAMLFRVFVDELGEGQIKQNHITSFRETLGSVGLHMPPIQSRAFVDQTCLLDSAFDCGLVQLCVSLFPESRLPEIIGYNWGYEQLPLHLMISANELESLGIDPYYFLLHVSIDNHSTGHAHLAARCAFQYLEHIRTTRGEEEMKVHWQRIVDGYYVNSIDPAKADLARIRDLSLSVGPRQLSAPPDLLAASRDRHDLARRRMLRILRGKSLHGANMHRPEAKMHGRSIRKLLAPPHSDRDESFAAALDALARSRWVRAGDPDGSPLLSELCAYGGKMFGVFTREELEVVRDWIVGLSDDEMCVDGGLGKSGPQIDEARAVSPRLQAAADRTLRPELDSATRRVAAIYEQISPAASPSALAAALARWEIPTNVEIAARNYVERLLRDAALPDGERAMLHHAPSASAVAGLSTRSGIETWRLLELDGVLLQDFFVPQLHATGLGDVLLNMWMLLQDYAGGAEGEPSSAMWRRVIARDCSSDKGSDALDGYRAFLLSISRFPSLYTPELIGAVGFWISAAYGRDGFADQAPCRLSGFERRRVVELREGMVMGWDGLVERVPEEWWPRMRRGWAVGKRHLRA
ncbi:hypothetical protein DFJ74DRAFT_731860 [Hyaloraphidium curvatum]|nr:hypothetical protein DFJ74DRAFT_731860 [Hyaloraphidium curvatum]